MKNSQIVFAVGIMVFILAVILGFINLPEITTESVMLLTALLGIGFLLISQSKIEKATLES